MLRVLFPWTLNIFSVEEVRDETAAVCVSNLLRNKQRDTHGVNGNVYVEWKWFIGPLP
jgi:hypothetical protein